MDELFGFVLFLSENDNKVLDPIICDLQKKYCNQPSFEPHLSIYHPRMPLGLTEAISIATAATNNIKPFTIESDGFGYQNNWSKILYIKVKPNPILESIRSRIGNSLNDKDVPPFVPHISLMYKDELSEKDRTDIIANLSIPKTFTVQGLHIQSPGVDNEDWRDYTKWHNSYSLFHG